MEKETVEENKLIAERVPPGDSWKLIQDPDNIIEGLVNTLTQYMRKTEFKGHYRLEPLNGKLYAIEEVQVKHQQPEPQVWDLYGESQQ